MWISWCGNDSTVGHGKSEGDRAHIESFDTYVLDVVHHSEDMNARYPGVPSMMLGHSLVRAAHWAIPFND